MERGGTLGTTATVMDGVTGGAGKRVRTSCGCLFSFPLTLAVNEDFFHAAEGRAPAPAPSPDEVFSMREKPAAKPVDAGRLAGVGCWSRADAAGAGLRVSGC